MPDEYKPLREAKQNLFELMCTEPSSITLKNLLINRTERGQRDLSKLAPQHFSRGSPLRTNALKPTLYLFTTLQPNNETGRKYSNLFIHFTYLSTLPNVNIPNFLYISHTCKHYQIEKLFSKMWRDQFLWKDEEWWAETWKWTKKCELKTNF